MLMSERLGICGTETYAEPRIILRVSAPSVPNRTHSAISSVPFRLASPAADMRSRQDPSFFRIARSSRLMRVSISVPYLIQCSPFRASNMQTQPPPRSLILKVTVFLFSVAGAILPALVFVPGPFFIPAGPPYKNPSQGSFFQSYIPRNEK